MRSQRSKSLHTSPKGSEYERTNGYRYKVTISVIVVLLALKIWGNGGSTQTSMVGEEEAWKAQAPTLVIYVFSDSDPEYERNLSYFVKEGIKVSHKMTWSRLSFLHLTL